MHTVRSLASYNRLVPNDLRIHQTMKLPAGLFMIVDRTEMDFNMRNALAESTKRFVHDCFRMSSQWRVALYRIVGINMNLHGFELSL